MGRVVAGMASSLAVLGAVGNRRPDLLVYEAFYRAMAGLGVACWDLAA